MWPTRPQKSQTAFTTLIEISLDSRLRFKEVLPSNYRSCWASYENIFEIVGIGSMSSTWDRTLAYCASSPPKNCIARSSSFLCAIMEKAEQEHLTVQEQIRSGLKFSISSQIMRNLVKYSVTESAPCFIDDASCWRSEIHKRSPYEYLDFKSC